MVPGISIWKTFQAGLRALRDAGHRPAGSSFFVLRALRDAGHRPAGSSFFVLRAPRDAGHRPAGSRNFRLLSILLPFLLALLIGFPSASSRPRSAGPDLWPKIEPAVLRAALQERQAMTFIVHLRQQADLQAPDQTASLVERRRAVVSALQATAQQSQAGLVTYLQQAQTTGQVQAYQPLWITNAVVVTGDRDALFAIAARPEVAIIRENRVHHLENPSPGCPAPATSDEPPAYSTELPATSFQQQATSGRSPEWNIAHVGADQVWNVLGIDGRGVVVANVDSGVDWQHPALYTRYRGYVPAGPVNHAAHWHCSTDEGLIYPADNHGHGTHTMGTIVGLEGIGMAPGAKWIAVKAFNRQGIGYDAWIHDAFQWLLAPNGDPALAPDVVNNSWGNDNGSYEAFRDDVRALRAAGIVPVFSAGNNGYYGAGTIGSPASYPESLAVGATDADDVVVSFSSRGPSSWGVKPDLVAPGVYIRSSTPGGGYAVYQGTSMAAPHVSGLVALLRQAQPTLSVTATIYAITSTARPLGTPVPNNNTGWGRIDACAAVRSVYQAGILTGVVTGAGAPLPGATVSLMNHGTGARAQTITDADGVYQIGLAPGRYDATVTAFGYSPALAFALPIVTNTVTTRDFALTALPVGTLAGTVLQAALGTPIPATIEVVGTPARATASASTGQYSLSLPVGTYDLRVTAWGYRVAHGSVTIYAGNTARRDFLLPPAPAILLVDSGAWYYDSRIASYRQALDALDYVYHVRSITATVTTFSAAQFTPYDVVIWSAPQDAPGYVGAGPALAGYLDNGGKLFVSGQDVGFWDGGGSGLFYAPYYATHLRARLLADDSGNWNLAGRSNGLLAGLSLTLNGPDSAGNQRYPDVIQPLEGTQGIVDYAGDGCGGLVVRACVPYRVVYLAFGLEGVSGAATRQEVLRRVLEGFCSYPPAVDLTLWPAQQSTVGGTGTTVAYTLGLWNNGLYADDVALSISGAAWSTTLWDDSFTRPLTHTCLTPCVATEVGVLVQIPPDAPPHTADVAVVAAQSTISPSLVVTASLHTKTPAPILLVNGSRWYDNSAAYFAALDRNGLPYDYWNILAPGSPAQGSPPLSRLQLYPQVIWWTGYDWYAPVSAQDEANLANYLDAGGRLFLSSQDYLYYHGDGDFARDALGVLTYTQDITMTTVLGRAGHPIGDGLGPYALTYPFRNWSDHVTPTNPANVAFVDPAGGARAACGITYQDPAHDARTVFFAWPFEALDEAAGAQVLGRVVSWLAPLGESTLTVDRRVAAAGDELAYTLVVRNADTRPVSATLSARLPAETTYVPGSVTGGARYDPAGHRIIWGGTLPAHGAHVITFRGTLADPLPLGTVVTATAILTDDTALPLRRPARTEVNVPLLDTATLAVSSPAPGPGAVLTCTARLTNTGTALATASLTVAVPAPLVYVPGSAWASRGTVNERGDGLIWHDPLAPGESAVVRLAARVPITVPNGLVLSAVAHIADGWHPVFTRSTPVRTRAPDLTPSSKAADRFLAESGTTLTYTLVLANSGDWPAAGATLRDILSAGVTCLSDSVTGGAWYDPAMHAVLWNGNLEAGAVITITYRVTVKPGPDRGTTLVNQALIRDGRGLSLTRQATVIVPFRVFLPVVGRFGLSGGHSVRCG